MRVDEVMTKDVKTCHPGEPVEQARERMRTNHFHHLVVVEGSQVLGIVSDRDLRGSLRRDAAVGDVMKSPVVTASPDTTVREAANLLRGRSIGCLPVLRHRKLLGIVTVTDLLELLGKGSVEPFPRVRATRRAVRPSRRK